MCKIMDICTEVDFIFVHQVYHKDCSFNGSFSITSVLLEADMYVVTENKKVREGAECPQR